MVSWDCQQPPLLTLECDLQMVGGGGGCGADWSGGWLGSFVSQACSMCPVRLFPLILIPPRQPTFPTRHGSCQSSHALSVYTPGPLSTFEALPVPRAGNWEPSPMECTGLQLLLFHCSGHLHWGVGIFSLSLGAQYTLQEPECQFFLLPGFGLGPPGAFQRP